MLDLNFSKLAWPMSLKPLCFDTPEMEDFPSWWLRNGKELKHLDPMIAEQWIFRHWTHSPYFFLPLNMLTWSIQNWTTHRILSDVIIPGDPIDPSAGESDFNLLNGYGGCHTSLTMNANGSWDYPIVVLYTPYGIKFGSEKYGLVRYVLIEGHLRLRYLNALQQCGSPSKTHSVFVLELANN